MRNLRLDNAKGILIILVVLGHFLEAADGWQDPALRAILTIIYMVHMPAFAFLAGATTRNDQTSRKLVERIAGLAVLLIAFQLIYTVPTTIRTGTYPDDPLQPHWILWFLLSLMCWLALLRPTLLIPAPITLSALVALAAGTFPYIGYDLSLSRTLVFFPFFVAGHIHGRKLIAHGFKSPMARYAALPAIMALAVIPFAIGIDHRWFYGSLGYDALGVTPVTGIGTRAALMTAALIASYCLIAVTPSLPGHLSQVGQASLSVFLLHGLVVKASAVHMRLIHETLGTTAAIILALVATSLTIAVFANPLLDRLLRKASASITLGPRSIKPTSPPTPR